MNLLIFNKNFNRDYFPQESTITTQNVIYRYEQQGQVLRKALAGFTYKLFLAPISKNRRLRVGSEHNDFITSWAKTRPVYSAGRCDC